MKRPSSITVYEHEVLRVDGIRLKSKQLKALQAFYGEKGVPYFTLVHNGVKFCEFVGVIQVGSTTIEVLPKADKYTSGQDWKLTLIQMLRAVGVFQVSASSSSALKLKSNSILELYFELFLIEAEKLLHHGLTKKYRKIEDNPTALKGSIQFAKHIQRNLVHKERFYVRHTAYDIFHPLHQILWKTIGLIKDINTSSLLQSRAATIQMWFPEMDSIKVNEATFQRITLNRKTEAYRKALEIARLLLLNFHPDISRGKNHVLALMFDMNVLWEKFIYVSIRKELLKTDLGVAITPQARKDFWKTDLGNRTRIRPDIVINSMNHGCVVVDTKWKNLTGSKPSDDDLKQMFVYHEYFEASRVALAYPGELRTTNGTYFTPAGNDSSKVCSLIGLPVQRNVREWQKEIGRTISRWILE